jgi:hypothetical protein
MSSKSRQPEPLDYQGKKNPENIKPVLRWSLTLSAIAMLAFAGLTFAGVMKFPMMIGYIFVAVAVADLAVAYTVFRD